MKDLTINEETGKPILDECIESLKNFVEKKEQIDVGRTISLLVLECSRSVPHRVYAAKHNTHQYIVSLIQSELEKNDQFQKDSLIHNLILCAHALTNKNPDIFNEQALKAVVKLLDTQKDKHLLCDILKWIQKACILHEHNRQDVVNESIVANHLVPLLKREEPEIIRNVCVCFRYLVLDDDVRVEFGKAHDHARIIAQATITDLTKLLGKFMGNQEVVSDLLLTIATLAVRNEFCVSVEEAGGLLLILEAMNQYPDSPKIIREAFKLFKALGGNDSVKVKVIQQGAAPMIESSLARFKADEMLAKHGLLCISTLALRQRENSLAFIECGVADTIIETMKIHQKNSHIQVRFWKWFELIIFNKLISFQRNSAWAIRNLVSRCREQSEAFLTIGAEEVLNQAMKEHPTVSQDIKSALRDLGADVHLNEEWKGNAEKSIKQEN